MVNIGILSENVNQLGEHKTNILTRGDSYEKNIKQRAYAQCKTT